VIDHERQGVFRGSELPRLLLLLVIALGGWAAVWSYLRNQGDPDEEPVVVALGKPQPVEPDRSPEFESVSDKTQLGFRDSAAYAKLIEKAHEATPTALAAEARRDIPFNQLWERPAHFRGVPVHILGTARHIDRYESKLSRTGWLYEAWVFTPEMRSPLPYVCVFEDAPDGLPIGTNVSERVVFNGYFLKLMRYQAADVPRAAPLLVGRIGWTPRPAPGFASRWGSTTWLVAGLVVMFTVSLFRWMSYLRRSLAPKPLRSILLDRPTEEIDPNTFADWVESVASDSHVPSAPDERPDKPSNLT
jgi:hypothetical protein